MAHDILIVDDEADIRSLISGILSDEGFKSRAAKDADEALNSVRLRRPSLVILDIWLQGSRLDGLQVLDEINRDHPDLPVLMISGHGNIETAVSAIKRGAYDFIEKPFKADRLLVLIERAIEAFRLRHENQELRLRAGGPLQLVGQSSAVQQLRQNIERIAPMGSRVLITGPAGSGKDIVARLIHGESKRSEGPFVAVHCATIHPETLDAELFGTETAASSSGGRKTGALERAHGGTLLLDEVADMPMETQGKILKFLQEQAFCRIGGTNKVQTDIRVIATTKRDLDEEVAEGRFLSDLNARLNVMSIQVPPLSDRREDIPLLLSHFMELSARASGLPYRSLSDDAIALLQSYEWPGNIRQLRNVAEWLLMMVGGNSRDPIKADMLPTDISAIAPAVMAWDRGSEIMGLPLREAREVFERQYLITQINRFGGNISRTAEFVGMERSALHRKLKSLSVGTQAESDKPAAKEE